MINAKNIKKHHLMNVHINETENAVIEIKIPIINTIKLIVARRRIVVSVSICFLLFILEEI
jgi:hypothetical protein